MDNIIEVEALPPPEPARAWSDLPTLTLGALLQAAGSAIRQGLPPELWLEAQVVAARRQDWGWLLELIDGQAANAATAARLTCLASNRTIAGISDELELEFDPSTLVGTCALLRIRPRFHARYQLGATLTGINPAFGAGLLTLQIERLRQTLKQEGILDRQHRLRRPADVTAVAVIAPEGSAGLADINEELERWAARGIMDVTWIDARAEGIDIARCRDLLRTRSC
jgi:exonuclease VII large subunit